MAQDLRELFGLDKIEKSDFDPRVFAARLRFAVSQGLTQIHLVMPPHLALELADMVDFAADAYPKGIPLDVMPEPLRINFSLAPKPEDDP